MIPLPNQTAVVEPTPSDVTWTHLIYGLHAVGVVLGIATSAFIVTSFLFGLPSIVAVILNYVKRGDVRGTFLESHFRWQIRTFWYALLWIAVASLLSLPLMLVLVGFVTLVARGRDHRLLGTVPRDQGLDAPVCPCAHVRVVLVAMCRGTPRPRARPLCAPCARYLCAAITSAKASAMTR